MKSTAPFSPQFELKFVQFVIGKVRKAPNISVGESVPNWHEIPQDGE
jgi:hypothetical protein